MQGSELPDPQRQPCGLGKARAGLSEALLSNWREPTRSHSGEDNRARLVGKLTLVCSVCEALVKFSRKNKAPCLTMLLENKMRRRDLVTG